MTKEEFFDAVENIYHGDAYDFNEKVEELWNNLQKSKKTMQRSYQRRIKALTEQD